MVRWREGLPGRVVERWLLLLVRVLGEGLLLLLVVVLRVLREERLLGGLRERSRRRELQLLLRSGRCSSALGGEGHEDQIAAAALSDPVSLRGRGRGIEICED